MDKRSMYEMKRRAQNAPDARITTSAATPADVPTKRGLNKPPDPRAAATITNTAAKRRDSKGIAH
jgi:hypothetical protein